ncbi:hypothetical protein ABZ599_37420 [Streptomyces misionensis]|uniref:hypothetical protein n=1 Tax=Streptomyces misionensis TaxID=67331 RepID=UPI0033EAFD93
MTVVRAVLVNLLRRDLELTPLRRPARPFSTPTWTRSTPAIRPRTAGPPRLARTTLDLAAADADAGVHLAERTRRPGRIAGAAPTFMAGSSPRTWPTARRR